MADETLIKEIVDRLEYFDIEKYLEARNIEYWTEGKNVKQGWINIQCLWCEDSSNHLGINLDSKTINCWICPIKGTAIRIILKLDKCSLRGVLRTVKEFSNIIHSKEKSLEYEHLTQRSTSIKLPSLAVKELLPPYRKFLEKRGFKPDYIFNKYNLLCSGPIGKYKHRLIAPFYYKKQLVTFTGRDITGKAKIPYKNLPAIESILSTKQTLYNIQNCSEAVIVVEGITDVWKIGDNCCATMGIKWTYTQLGMLSVFKRVFILYDTEKKAQESAERMYSDLSLIVSHVERLKLDLGDPGDMNKDDIKHLRKEVFGKIY